MTRAPDTDRPSAAVAVQSTIRPAGADRDRRSTEPVTAATMFHNLTYRFVAAVDIEGFTKLDVLEQVKTQRDLGDALDVASGRAGLTDKFWLNQVSGDGGLAVLPHDTDGLRLVADYPRELARALSETNRRRHPRPRLRIRLALHHGTLTSGHLGPVGPAPIEVSRLLDAELVRQELKRAPERDLALVVSTRIYDDVIQSRFRGLDPREFSRIDVEVKGAPYAGYIHVGRPRAGTGHTRRRIDWAGGLSRWRRPG